jgi:hypothetical protein
MPFIIECPLLTLERSPLTLLSTIKEEGGGGTYESCSVLESLVATPRFEI